MPLLLLPEERVLLTAPFRFVDRVERTVPLFPERVADLLRTVDPALRDRFTCLSLTVERTLLLEFTRASALVRLTVRVPRDASPELLGAYNLDDEEFLTAIYTFP